MASPPEARQAHGLPDGGGIIDSDHASFTRVRNASERLCAPLAIEDFGIQPMDDASPPKWHLAHTTWFFETFLLKSFLDGYRVFDERYEYLFNSYYNGIGELYPRPRRGMLSRPTVATVFDYRRHVDEAMGRLLEQRRDPELLARLMLGLHHEQQHQELLLTDIKYNLGTNPLLPAYRDDLRDRFAESGGSGRPRRRLAFDGGIVEIGAAASAAAGAAAGAGPGAFCFDNEQPRHQVLLRPFELDDSPVSNGEFLEFIEDGGYARPELWLSDAWAALAALPPIDGGDREPGAAPRAGPLYWYRRDGEWYQYRLSGPAPLDPDAPVVHVSFYEADAFARWAGARLPTEAEWEHAAGSQRVAGHFADGEALHPLPAVPAPEDAAPAPVGGPLRQLYGDVWEWTSSPYGPYPGYRPLAGTLGEYNGKFMSNQLVLRGGSCATPPGHVRPTYRNFFYPGDQWQFSGLRLAHDV